MQSRKIGTGDVAKASVWYTVSNFLAKGIGYLTLPIFARLMTKTELGDYSNFLVWIDILTIIVGISIESSINRARIDYPGKLDEYCSTILLFTSALAGVAYLIVQAFMPVFSKWWSLEPFYIHMIFVYLMVLHAYSILMARQRIFYRYKASVALSLGYAVGSTVCSIILVIIMQDKYMARSVGHILPYILICVPAYVYLVKKGKTFKWSYCKYAVLFCWPFVPHLLALKVLNASDRIMITNMIGSEATATYTIANNCVSIATLFFTSLNTAISPWVFDKLVEKDYKALKQITLPYIGCFVVLVQLIQLMAPEVLLIIGGAQYIEAKECFLPLFSSVVVQFCYALYVNIEQYSRKTWAIAAGTLLAAVVNVALNLWLIPIFGYVVAAYTTLVGYCVLFLVHYTFVRIIGYKNIYNDKFVFMAILYAIGMQVVIRFLYNNTIIRYAVVAVLMIGIVIALVKNKEQILQLLKRKKKPKVSTEKAV